MLPLLPSALLALLFASPALSEPTSKYDPFRALELQAPKQAGNPICCLKPQTPLEPVDDDILLSFEEWKLKQLAVQPEVAPNPKLKNATQRVSPGDGGEVGSVGDSTDIPAILTDGSAPSTTLPPSEPWTDISPQLRIPTTDRFNYASLECSARVHTAHRSAKSPASILSAKRDRYMLSPCNKSKEKQFVVVELCDDIRIDTVQLANFEFFSGVFKEFTVSATKTSPDPDTWTFVGTYRAKNVRGVQTFHTPNSLRGFYRYIRIDFQSHYGSEYYCPVSLLRVYGLTHLEEWKWDVWQEESRAKQIELNGRQVILPVQPFAEATTPTSLPSTGNDAGRKSFIQSADISSGLPILTDSIVPYPTQPPNPAVTSIRECSASDSSDEASSWRSSSNTSAPSEETTVPPNSSYNILAHSTDTFVSSTVNSSTTPTSPYPHQKNTELPTSSESANHAPSAHPTVIYHTSQHSPPGGSNYPSSSSPTIIASSPSVAVIPIIPTSLPPAHGGESIYRTIINRVAAVENNQTLYMRYIEQQNSAIRDVIKRLGEDVGRLEGISRAQSLVYQRALSDWEKQRYQLQMEYGDLVNRIEYLSEEIILEKRLGAAQLCLLLAVLVFLGLTRGSRPENFASHGPVKLNSSVREWGKRHFTLSNDWTNRFKTKVPKNSKRSSRSSSASRTRTPTASRPKLSTTKSIPPPLSLNHSDDDKLVFPSSSNPRRREPLETMLLNTAPISSDRGYSRSRTTSNPRSLAPSLRSTPATRRAQYAIPHRPITPTRSAFRPAPLQRSNSQGGVPVMPQSTSWGGSAHAPKSAKRWARSAHLHEVKVAPPSSRRTVAPDLHTPNFDRKDRTPREFELERENIDIFSSPADIASFSDKALAESLLFKRGVGLDDGDPWVDTDSIDDSEVDAGPVIELPSSRIVKRVVAVS